MGPAHIFGEAGARLSIIIIIDVVVVVVVLSLYIFSGVTADILSEVTYTCRAI